VSVLRQTDQDFEIIVGDDGAQGEAVVRRINDPRIRYVRHRNRLGIAGNWTAMLDAAQGDYLSLLMDDDRWASTFLERTRARLDEDATVSVCFSNHTFVGSADAVTRPTLLPAGRHHPFVIDFLRLKPVAVSAAIYRRECWAQVRPLPDTAAADMVLFGRMAEAGAVFYYVDEALMAYRTHAHMFSSSKAFRDDIVRAWESLEVSGQEARALRDRRLAEALVSRAAQALSEGRAHDASTDLRVARRLFPPSKRALLLALASRTGPTTSVATLLARVRRKACGTG
jgi:glycosyltransferase involved in cell wall biosynthesis